MNTSLPQKYENGTIQMLVGEMPCLIESAYAYQSMVYYNVTARFGDATASERDIRPMTFGEFLWFRHPKEKHMMIGKNRALPVLIWAAAMLTCSVASIVGTEGVWRWVWPTVTVASIAAVLIATKANHKGKQA